MLGRSEAVVPRSVGPDSRQVRVDHDVFDAGSATRVLQKTNCYNPKVFTNAR